MIDQIRSHTVFGITGRVRVQGDQFAVTCTVMPSAKKLGAKLTADENARAVLANYIRQEYGLKRGEPCTIVHWKIERSKGEAP